MTLPRLREIRDAIKTANADGQINFSLEELHEINEYQQMLLDAWGHNHSIPETINLMIKDKENPRPSDYKIQNTDGA